MAGPIYLDRVRETTITTGTGTYTLAGAVTGFQSFSGVGNGNTCYYAVTDGTRWEVGLGTWATGGTLARTTILASSNSGSAVSWGVGAKAIWLDYPAVAASTPVTVASRTLLASIDTTKYTDAYLTETLRDGWFQWSSSNHATGVTADPQQAVFVPPTSGPSGSSGAWVRRDYSNGVWAQWAGAAFDNATNDTTALAGAFSIAKFLIVPLLLPSGTALIDSFAYGSPGNGRSIPVIGCGSSATKLKKRTSDGLDLFTVNNSPSLSYVGLLNFSGFTLEGIDGNTPAVLDATDMVRAKLEDIVIQYGIIGAKNVGGISNSFHNCTMQLCGTGVSAKYVGGNYDGKPNLNWFVQCRILGNTALGVDFDDGSILAFDGCDIEANGTTPDDTSNGAIRVGSSVVGLALIVQNSWFEGNAGKAAVILNGGFNIIRDSMFVANPNATYDTYETGGTYSFSNISYRNVKTNNFEESTVGSGNQLIGCIFVGSNSIDTTKTAVISQSAGLQNITGITMTGNAAKIVASGPGTNIPVIIKGKGINGIRVQDGTNNNLLDLFDGTAGSGTDWLIVARNASSMKISTGSGNPVTIGDLLQVQSLASDPTGVTGTIYYNSATGKFRGYNAVAVAWQDLN